MPTSITRRAAVLAAAAALAAVAVPQAASAAVVSQSGGVVIYTAANAERNLVFPFVSNGRVRLQETNSATPLSAGLGCTIVSTRVAQCGSASRVILNLGDADDVYYGTGAGSTPTTVNAGAGNDILFDGAGAARQELYSGGAGRDVANYSLTNAAVSLSLDGRPNDGEAFENDTIASDVEDLTGGAGNDFLIGGAGQNVFHGGRGNDFLNPLGGADIVTGDDGDDRFETRDGLRDTINGGAGVDSAARDAIDAVVG